MTCDRLFDTYPDIYFWTFTFKNVYADWIYSGAWASFIRDLNDWCGGMLAGVRVLEPHKSHGLHYHALLNQYIPMAVARRIGAKVGMGFMWVEKADRSKAGYLSKYLTKRNGKLAKGIQRWHTVGGFRGVKKNQIVMDSPAHRTMRLFTTRTGKLPFRLANMIFHWAKHHGHLWEWDFETKRKFLTEAATHCRTETLFNKVAGVVLDKYGEPVNMFPRC